MTPAALVTGGGRGLGVAIARAFAQSGALGSVVDLETSPCEEGWAAFAADVTDERDVERAAALICARLEALLGTGIVHGLDVVIED